MNDMSKLVDKAICLNEEIKEKKKALEKIKAQLQGTALADMENKNLRYMRFAGACGNCEIGYKTKVEIDDYIKLIEALPGTTLAQDKIKRTQETKYEVEARFKKSLIAILKADYKPHDLEEILKGMGLTDKAVKLALKKLKGDYAADHALLNSLGCFGEMEEELDAVREQKNYELVTRFFDFNTVDFEALKKAVWLEDSLSLTLNANKAG